MSVVPDGQAQHGASHCIHQQGGGDVILFPEVCRFCTPPKRCADCHAWCPDYLAAKAEHEARTKADRARRQAQRDADAAAYILQRR